MSFVFYSNRAVDVVNNALGSMGGQAWQPGDPAIDLAYFDTYGGKQLPEGVQVKRQLIPRANTAVLDQKHLLAKRLTGAGINSPRHYFHPDEVPDEPDSVWYIKDTRGTGGKQVWLCRTADIAQYFKPGYLIQEAMEDIALFNDKKFTIRLYVLVHQNKVYWYPEGFLVLHALSYERQVLDSRIHFSHSGYMERLSDVQLLATRFYAGFARLEPALRELLQKVFGLFAVELGEARRGSDYCLFGVDVLELPEQQVALIEINDRPSFTHTSRINLDVNQPMIQAMSAVLIPEHTQGALVSGARRFEQLCNFE